MPEKVLSDGIENGGNIGVYGAFVMKMNKKLEENWRKLIYRKKKVASEEPK